MVNVSVRRYRVSRGNRYGWDGCAAMPATIRRRYARALCSARSKGHYRYLCRGDDSSHYRRIATSDALDQTVNRWRSRHVPVCDGVPASMRLSSILGSGSLIAESWIEDGATLGDTPRSQGTTPPVLTYSASVGGSLTGNVFPYVQIDGAGARGTATFKVSYDDGATFPHTGILTAATNTLPGIGAHITANWAVGTYATNNIYQPLCAAVADATGLGNNAVQATASRMPILRMVAFNGKRCLDYGTGTTFALEIANVTLPGDWSYFSILQGNASSGYIATHVTDGSSYVFSRNNAAGSVIRVAGASQWNVTSTANWCADGVRRTMAMTSDGTHAGHALWRNGVAEALTNLSAGNPGTATANGTFFIGNRQLFDSSFRGLKAGWVIGSRCWSAQENLFLHNYATVTKGLAL